jgi:asparagine synthase (glutamine-hydrolysing)
MCGITGYFSLKNDFNSELFSRANNIIKHRGPDDYGYVTINANHEVRNCYNEDMSDFQEDSIIGALGFRRLSIIDLSKNGHQPMTEESGNYWIIFNGEIYNYIEIREILLTKRYKFNSSSDTEVILNAYAEWGTKCLERFNGMWAFCLYDKKNRKLFCARDRFGVKPFYFAVNDEMFAFGSEIKQLTTMFPNEYCKVNSRLAFDFLVTGSYGNETNETFFRGIFKLSAGCYLEINLDKNLAKQVIEKRWWDLPAENNHPPVNDKAVFDTIAGLFNDSILLRLRSDVAVGTALSGGLDSSGITSMLSKIYNGDAEKNKVFTITSNDPTIDDTYYASIITQKIPVTSFNKGFEACASLDDLAKFIWHQDEPLQSSSIFGSWQLYKFFREMDVTVAIDGQGADELMGGYNSYPFRRYLIDILKNYGLKYYIDQIRKISNVYNKPYRDIVYNTVLSFALELLKNFNSFYYSKKLEQVKPYINGHLFDEEITKSHIIHRDFYQQKMKFNSIVKRNSYELTKHTNLPGILRQVDRNSMAFSVESRLPFLDYRLVEYLYSLPVHYMIRDGYTKYAYRKAMEGIVPNEVLWRKTKVGFKMPEFELLRDNFDFLKELFNAEKDMSYVNYEKVRLSIEHTLKDKASYDNVIWRILCFTIWKNTFKLT